MSILLWGIYPYAAVVVLIGGLVLRARYDRFGWTSHSSQLHESKLLRVGSPLFHFGMLFVVLGHVVGLLIPESWTAAVGVSDHVYHLTALATGSVAGAATLAGLGILVYRRLRNPGVRRATLPTDPLLYPALVLVVVLGLTATTLNASGCFGTYDYRTGIAEWFRSLFALQPETALMAAAPLAFRIHVFCAFLLIAMVPFTRLVHIFSFPLLYIARPYVVYRRNDPAGRTPAG
ncbi:respiratory nitrate reductase subunit gamma [Streptomyces sp. NPDC007100]|uniref:respiratory nitrate reductase subunit gamma n=1 Tax=Streptomyces sp. NPDC007100 TaxID=3155602 RepID=UPI00340131F2